MYYSHNCYANIVKEKPIKPFIAHHDGTNNYPRVIFNTTLLFSCSSESPGTFSSSLWFYISAKMTPPCHVIGSLHAVQAQKERVPLNRYQPALPRRLDMFPQGSHGSTDQAGLCLPWEELIKQEPKGS